jgi:hypothetical protein
LYVEKESWIQEEQAYKKEKLSTEESASKEKRTIGSKVRSPVNG